MKYKTNMSLGIKIMKKLYHVPCTKYQEPGTMCPACGSLSAAEDRSGPQFLCACLPQAGLGALPAEGRLCVNKKEKIRRGGLFWKRI